MNFVLIFYFMFAGWPGEVSPSAEFPRAQISNGLIEAGLLLPDSAIGYYQGTRFDWSGVIETLEYKGHTYFGQWFKKYDPKRHDAIMGPVEEFEPVGYEAASVGDIFLKIGVGALVKKTDKPYSSFNLYDIRNPGKWKVKKGVNQVEFTQHLKDAKGYSYVYRKTVRLQQGRPELVLEHSLKNTGKLTIETNVYDHNFYLIDNEPTGPEIKIKFPFELQGTGRGLGTFAKFNGNEINYTRNLNEREDMYIGPLEGFGKGAEDYDFRIENQKSGAGVRIIGDKPLSRMVFWASPTVSCPEPYIHIKAEPGKEFTWKITYQFYELPKAVSSLP